MSTTESSPPGDVRALPDPDAPHPNAIGPDAPDADAIAAAVLSCGSVADLAGGGLGEIATYLPGRRVTGVAVRRDGPFEQVVVHVVAHYGPTMTQIAAEVTAAVRSVAGPVDVRVGIDDLLLPGSPTARTPEVLP